MQDFTVKNVKTGETEVIGAATATQALFAAVAIARVLPECNYMIKKDTLEDDSGNTLDVSAFFVIV